MTYWQGWIIITLLLILAYGEYLIMAAIDDLTTAVTNLEAASSAVVQKITTLKASGVDPVAVEALVARVNTVTTNLNTAAQ